MPNVIHMSTTLKQLSPNKAPDDSKKDFVKPEERKKVRKIVI